MKQKSRTEQFESWGMKKYYADKDGQYATKPVKLNFGWTFDPNMPPFLAEDYKKRNEAKSVEKLQMAFDYFREFIGIDKYDFYFTAVPSYYDTFNVECSVYANRMETDEEFEARKHLAAEEAERRRRAAQKSQETKEKNEREQYERLKKKYEGS